MSDQALDSTPRRLAISLFGRFDARLDEQPLGGFEYNKVRALLAYLAVESDRPQPRAGLCALLWPDLGESAARQNLSQALTRLRQALGDKQATPPFLLTTTETVQLNPLAPVDVDVLRFTALMGEAEAHTHRDWHLCTPCATRLRAAITLYQGDFLAQLYVSDSALFEEWALPLRQRLRLRMLSALERLARYAEWRGEYADAARYAQRHIALEPLRDDGHRELMRLLALDGQQTAATLQYEYLRRTLAAELDAEPEPATTALYEQIRAGGAPDALRRLHAPPSNIPAPPTALIGREAEANTVCGQLLGSRAGAPARLLTITGAPGIGKTRLALEVARRLRFDFADGVHVVELAPVVDAAEAPAAIATVLGVRERPRQTIVEALCEHLQSAHSLLVLDNFEHILDAAAFVGELLARCPALSVLITSRTPLRVRAEYQYALQPLAVPAEHAMVDVAARAEAVQLFVHRARAVRPEFELHAENVAPVAAICRRLDGLPLAIELAAPRLKSLSVGEMLRQFESRLSGAGAGPRDVPARHRTLRGAIQWSYDRLSPDEQQVFAHMGVFLGGCTVDAVQAVVGDSPAALPALEALHDASLLHTQPSDNTTRFLLLETIGEFALEMLTRSGERDRAHRRHLDYFAQLADAAYTELLGPDQAQWSTRIAAEHDNLRAALRWALRHRQIEAALRIAAGIWRFWWQRGFVREGLEWLEAALAHHQDAAPDVQTKALRAAGVLAMGLNEYARARGRLEQALEVAHQHGLTYDRAAALTNLGLVLREQGELEAASAYLEQSVALQRQMDDPRPVKFPLIVLAELYGRLGNITQAGALYEECLRLNRELGDAEGTANALYGMGWVANARGDARGARRWCDDAMELYTTLHHQFGLGWCYYLLGDIARDQGDDAEALLQYRRCLSLWMEREDMVSAALALDDIARVLYRLHDAARAVRLMGAARAIRDDTNVELAPNEQARLEATLARCRVALGAMDYRRAWNEGQAMRPQQAAMLALRDEAEAGEFGHTLRAGPVLQA
jgi:predicted ATPase/DNA-binding SARP family transcriptional activator